MKRRATAKAYLRLLPVVVWLLGQILLVAIALLGPRSASSDYVAGAQALYAVGCVVLSVFWATAFIWVTNRIYGEH